MSKPVLVLNQASSTNPPRQSSGISFNNENTSTINFERVNLWLIRIKPLTLPFTDAEGCIIQLWKKTTDNSLLGAILDKQGRVAIIPGDKIVNILNPEEKSENLIYRLENAQLRMWDIVFDVRQRILTIWPHLEAAGKFDQIKPEIIVAEAQRRLRNLHKGKGALNDYHYQAALREATGEIVAMNLEKGRPCNHTSDIKNYRQAARKMQRDINKRLNQDTTRNDSDRLKLTADQRKELVKVRDQSATLEKQATRELIRIHDVVARRQAGFLTDAQSAYYRRIAFMQKVQGAAKQPFEQLLQQKRLVDSFNANHRYNPISAKGYTGGSIGGVACSTEYIEGLFDSPESIFEQDHYFTLPKLSNDQMPFTDNELRQILRELAIGIYTHSTVPFFSLHFNQNADLVPVIHPVYEHTLVGRVISMLDYIMKGYLNGGVFEEKFIDQWHQNPSWYQQSSSALQQLIDFGEYCQNKLQGEDQQYQSLRSLHKTILSLGSLPDFLDIGIESGLAGVQESPILRDFSGFSNSFRIIAKQNSIQKEKNVFIIDSDFDVLYTINPSPQYTSALEQHLRQHGSLPPSYQSMLATYEIMSKRIHDHMVKMPLCRKYFSMLSVINFFSSYFSTLKKHRKIPVLPIHTTGDIIKGSPALFPHLPIKTACEEHLQWNPYLLLKSFLTNNSVLEKELVDLFKKAVRLDQPITLQMIGPQKQKELLRLLKDKMRQNILNLCSPAFKRYMLSSSGQRILQRTKQLFIKPTSIRLLNDLLEILQGQLDLAKKEAVDLSSLPDHIIQSVINELFQQCLKYTNNQAEHFFQHPLPHSAAKIRPEMKDEEVEKGKRIVGGCGMHLEVQKVQASLKAANLWANHWAEMSTLKPETWMEVGADIASAKKDAIFRLSLEDIPAGIKDDYHWMEASLLTPNGQNIDQIEEQIQKRLEIQEAMISGNQSGFIELINTVTDFKPLVDRYQRTLLHEAALISDSFYVKSLLKKGLSYQEKDIYGYLPLHYAAINDSPEALKLLLDEDWRRKESLNATGCNGATPLIVAILHGKSASVDVLLARKADFTSLTSGYNALHCALHEGNFDVIKIVLNYHTFFTHTSFLNKNCEEEGTPLMLACELDSPQLIQRLIKNGANAKAIKKDGETAIGIAVQRNCTSTLEILLKHATPSSLAIERAAQMGIADIVELLTKEKEFYAHRNSYGDTALHTAIRFGNISAAKVIIANSQSKDYINIRNLGQETAADCAAAAGIWQIVNLLFDKDADINISYAIRAGYHPILEKIFNKTHLSQPELQNFLLVAAQVGNHEVIEKILIPKGANIHQLKGSNDWQILHYLAKSDGLGLFRKCISSQDMLHPLPREEGKTLAYIAAEHGSERILSFLLQQIKRKSISLQNHYKDRHLFYAVIEMGKIDFVQKMLEDFEDLSVDHSLDLEGSRPIHVAAKTGSKGILKLLRQRGANLEIKDNKGFSALDYAVCSGAIAAVSYLLEGDRSIPITPKTLFIAAAHKDARLLQILMKHNPLEAAKNEALMLSIYENNTDAFLRLLECQASWEYVAEDGWTPLLYASAHGQYEIVENILHHSPIDKRVIHGNNALHLACQYNHFYCVRLLLQAGFKDEKNYANQTPPPGQVKQSASELAKGDKRILALLQGQQDIYYQEIEQFTNALEQDDLEQMQQAIDQLPINEILLVEYEGKKIWGTSLQLLLILGRNKQVFSIADDLLKSPVLDLKIQNLPQSNSKGDSLVHLLIRAGVSPFNYPLDLSFSAKNNLGQMPLHIAAEYANPTLLKDVLKKTSNIDIIDNAGQTPIFYAIKGNNKENLFFLIEQGANLRHTDHSLKTPLIYACEREALSLIKILLQGNADPNQAGTIDGILPLHLSLKQETDEIARCLLFHGANCNKLTAGGDHAIHFAAQNGKAHLLRILSAKGLSLNIKNRKGIQPIHSAVISGKKEIIEEILSADQTSAEMPVEIEAGKDPSRSADDLLQGATPLHLAAFVGQAELMRYFLDHHHVNPLTKTEKDATVLSFAAANGSTSVLAPLFSYDFSSDSAYLHHALIRALQKDNVDAVIALYKQGVSINTNLTDGSTGLHLASLFGALQSTQWLLINGADCLHTSSDQEIVGKNALEIAATNQAYEQFKLLLDWTLFDIDHINGKGETLMHIAVKSGNLGHLAILLKHGAALDLADVGGYTPLHIAAKEGHTDIVRLLLICGANASAKTANDKLPADLVKHSDQKTKEVFEEFSNFTMKEGESQLHLAVKSKNLLAVLILADIEDIDQQDDEGTSALHLAVKEKQVDYIEHLLRIGAKIDVKDKFGRTPLWYACIGHNNTEMTRALIHKGANAEEEDENGITILAAAQTASMPNKEEILLVLQR